MTPASVLPDPALNDLPESDETSIDPSHEASGDAPADGGAASSADASAEASAPTDAEAGVSAEAGGVEEANAGADDATPAALPPTVTVPDRADAPVSETIERFMRAIAAVVPVDRIEELHLFSPLRQGGVETGIAVIAARADLPPEPAPVEHAPELAPELALDGAADGTDGPATAASTDDETRGSTEADAVDAVDADAVEGIVDAGSPGTDVVEAELLEERTAESTVDAELVDANAGGVVEADTGDDAIANADANADMGTPVLDATPEPDDSPYAPEVIEHIVEDAMETTAEIINEVAASEQAVAVPIERHTVYTARYRLVQKGPERGKWEADVRDEADAPLITVEMVVRGVQRRAGEASETTRYSGPQVARILARGAKPA